MKPSSAHRHLLCIATSAVLTISYAHAQSNSWLGDSAGSWTDATKWTGGTTPADGADNTATFGDVITADRTITLGADRTIGDIVASDTTHNYTLSGANILTLDRTDMAVPSINVTSSTRSLIISSQISGTDGLRKTGAGTLSLTNSSNNFTGGTFINAGTLGITADGRLGAAAGGITFTGNGALSTFGTITSARQITLNSGVTGTILAAASGGTNLVYTNSGKITGAGNLLITLSGSGTRSLTFSSTANDFTGSVRVDNNSGQQIAVTLNSLSDVVGAGNVIMSMSIANGPNTLNYGSGAIAPMTLNNRRFELAGTATAVNAIFSNQNTTQAITINTDLLISSAGNKGLSLDAAAGPTNVFAGKMANGSSGQVLSMNKTGGGTWALTNTANSHTGNTTISAGILEVTKLADGGSNSSIGAGSGNLVFGSGATLRYTGTGDSSNRAFTSNANANNVGFTLNSSGTGPLEFTNTAAITNTQTGASQGRFYAITGNNTGDNILAAQLTNNLANTAALTKGGPGKWVLTNANTFTGGLFIQSGTLELRSGASNLTQSIAGLATNVGEATLISNKSGVGTLSTTLASRARGAGGSVNIVSTGGTNGTDNSVLITGGAQGFIDRATFFNGADFAAQSATNGYVRALEYGVDPTAAAVDTITASNHVKITTSYSGAGDTLLSLNLAGSGVGWTSSSGNLTVPGILKSGGGSVATLSGGDIDPLDTELVIRTDTASDLLNISSNLSQGTGALTKSGAGTLTLSGTNTYTGVTHVNAGTLSIGANVHLGAEATGAQLNLKGGTLQATGTFGLHNGSPGTNNRAVTLLSQSGIDVTGSNTLTLSGVISNSSSAGTVAPGFNKTGTGTLDLRGTNTYTGPTHVIAGTLTLGASNVLPNGSAISIGNAILDAATFTDTAGSVDAAGAATLNLGGGAALAFADSSAIDWTGGSLAITGTFVSGSSLRFGTTSGGLTPAQIALITGVGPVTLNSSGFLVIAGGGNTFADWLALNAPATGFVTDSDNDGIPNGVENVLGSNPNAFNTGLTEVSSTATSATFKHALNPTLASDVTYAYQWSTDLVEWKASTQSNTGGTTATIAASAPVLGVVTVTTTITGGPSGKLFTRLNAVKAP